MTPIRSPQIATWPKRMPLQLLITVARFAVQLEHITLRPTFKGPLASLLRCPRPAPLSAESQAPIAPTEIEAPNGPPLPRVMRR